MNSDGPATPEPAAATRRRLLGKTLISMFAVLNIVTVFRSNRTSWASRAIGFATGGVLGEMAGYRLRYTGWLIDRYAHLSGLNNRWEMFSHQSRFNWWYGIQAVTPDQTAVDLNLPGVGQRTFAQRTFFDFREAKYHLNLYPDPTLRQRYGRYLCSGLARVRVPDHGRVEKIRFLLHHQMLRSRADARVLGTHLEPNIFTRTLDEVSCLPRG
jgi:hypothetical protein